MLGSTRRKFLTAAGAIFALSGAAQAQELPSNESGNQNETSEAGTLAQPEDQEQGQKQEQEGEQEPDGPHLNDSGAGVFPEGSGSIIEDVTRSSDGIRMTLLFPADQSDAPSHDQGTAMMPGGGRGSGNGNGGLLGEQNQGQNQGGQQGSPASGLRRGNGQNQRQRQGQNQGQQQGPGDVQTSDGASSGIMGLGANGSEATQTGNETSKNDSNSSR